MGEIKVGSRVQARDMAGNEKGVVIRVGRDNPFGYWTDMALVKFDVPSPYNGDTQAWMRFEQLELEVTNLANVAPVTARELLAIDLDRATINPYPEPQEPMYDADWAAAPYDHAYHERRATDALCANAGICPLCGNDHSVEDCEF